MKIDDNQFHHDLESSTSIITTLSTLPENVEDLLTQLSHQYELQKPKNKNDDEAVQVQSGINKTLSTENLGMDFLLRDRLQEEEEKHKLLLSETSWLGETVKSLRELQFNLQSIEQVLKQIETERTEALSTTETLNEACAHITKDQKTIEDFVSVVRQRVEVFDRLFKLKEEIGDDPKMYIANLTINSFQAKPSQSLDNNQFEGVQLDSRSNTGAAAPLFKILMAIDDACDFFHLHSDFLESQDYLSQYKRLKSDILIGIRQVLTQTLEKCERRIERKDQEQPKRSSSSMSTMHFTLHYVQFRAAAAHLKCVMTVLYERSKTETDGSYSSALDIIEGIYVSTRLRLVTEPLKSHLTSIFSQKSTSEYVDEFGSHYLPILIRQATTLVLSVAQLELKTYQSFFVMRQPREAINTLMASLGDLLLDLLRPAILGSSSLSELRETSECLLLDILDSIGQSLPSNSSVYSTASAKMTSDLGALYRAIYHLQKDLQERLIFKSEAYVMTCIRGFEPTDKDLNYPSVLFEQEPDFDFSVISSTPLLPTVDGRSPSLKESKEPGKLEVNGAVTDRNNTLEIVSTSNVVLSQRQTARLSKSGGWYPPLDRLAECLSGAQHVVTPTAFQILAQHAVEGCLASLVESSRRLQDLKGSTFDANLFSIKHLLNLREQVTTFNCDLIINETVVDFGAVRSRIWNFLRSTSSVDTQGPATATNTHNVSLTVGSLFHYFMPELQSSRVDTKRDLEVALKQQCESFVAHSSALLLLPILRLSSTLAEASRSQHRQQSTDESLNNETVKIVYVPVTRLKSSINEFRSGIISIVPRLVFNLQAYLIQSSNQTIEIKLNTFPQEIDDGTDSLATSKLSSSTYTTPSEMSNSSEVVLINAMRISVLEAVKHIQSSILTSKFQTESNDIISISLNELKQSYGWWTPEKLSKLIDTLLRNCLPEQPAKEVNPNTED